MTFDRERLICYCNDLTLGEIADFIKKSGITQMEELLEQNECSMGDKCEACHEEGYENDGFSLAMVLGLVKENRL